jgi:hypothetical protein
VEWIEKFHVWKMSGGGGLMGLAAKEADAFLTLEKEGRESGNDVQQSI